MRTIIGIAGKKRAGKNTAAEVFTQLHGFKELSFAHPLKKACATTFDISYEHFHDQDKKEREFSTPVVINEEHISRLVRYLKRYLPGITEKQIENIRSVALGKAFSTPRKIVQFIGTEVVRQQIDSEFWCLALAEEMKAYDKVVIPDVRFPEERECIRAHRGEILLIDRDFVEESTDTHISEGSLGHPAVYSKVFSNNSSIDELHLAIDEWYAKKRS